MTAEVPLQRRRQILGYRLFRPITRLGGWCAPCPLIFHDADLHAVVAHEIGHHLNLIYIWGDQNCGDDQADDTRYTVPPTLTGLILAIR